MELNQQSLLEKYSTKTALNKRQELLKQFQDRLNKERGTYKPLTGKQIGLLTSYIPTNELYDFYQLCGRAKNFSACWWWTVLPNKKNKNEV